MYCFLFPHCDFHPNNTMNINNTRNIFLFRWHFIEFRFMHSFLFNNNQSNNKKRQALSSFTPIFCMNLDMKKKNDYEWQTHKYTHTHSQQKDKIGKRKENAKVCQVKSRRREESVKKNLLIRRNAGKKFETATLLKSTLSVWIPSIWQIKQFHRIVSFCLIWFCFCLVEEMSCCCLFNWIDTSPVVQESSCTAFRNSFESHNFRGGQSNQMPRLYDAKCAPLHLDLLVWSFFAFCLAPPIFSALMVKLFFSYHRSAFFWVATLIFIVNAFDFPVFGLFFGMHFKWIPVFQLILYDGMQFTYRNDLISFKHPIGLVLIQFHTIYYIVVSYVNWSPVLSVWRY